MDYEQVVNGRRSIRGYLDKPVPKPMIEEVLALAMRAPTSLNTQPWNFFVVTGEVLDKIRKGNVDNILAGVPDSREFRGHGAYEGAHRERQIGIAKQLFGAMGIFDCGGVVNALVNAAWSRGLGCVINSQGIMQSPVVREHAQIPEDQVIMICVAMGWPDEAFPANAVVSTRKSVDEAAVFVGFDEG